MFEMHLKFASRKFCTKPPMVLETANTTSISMKAPFDDVFLSQISAPSIRERVPRNWSCKNRGKKQSPAMVAKDTEVRLVRWVPLRGPVLPQPRTWPCFHQKTSSGVASSGGRIWQFLAPVIRRVDRWIILIVPLISKNNSDKTDPVSMFVEFGPFISSSLFAWLRFAGLLWWWGQPASRADDSRSSSRSCVPVENWRLCVTGVDENIIYQTAMRGGRGFRSPICHDSRPEVYRLLQTRQCAEYFPMGLLCRLGSTFCHSPQGALPWYWEGACVGLWKIEHPPGISGQHICSWQNCHRWRHLCCGTHAEKCVACLGLRILIRIRCGESLHVGTFGGYKEGWGLSRDQWQASRIVFLQVWSVWLLLNLSYRHTLKYVNVYVVCSSGGK